MSNDKDNLENAKSHHGFSWQSLDYLDNVIDLNQELVRHPAATFYARVKGTALEEAGLSDEDVVVIDKSIEPAEGDIVLCFIDGEFVARKLTFKAPESDVTIRLPKQPVSYNVLNNKNFWLLPLNNSRKPIFVSDGNDFTLWGVITYIIKKVR